MATDKEMTQVETFLGIIKQAEEKAEQEWLDGLPLAEWWKQFKEVVIRPTFENAVEALKSAGYATASQIDKNGTGLLLQAGSPSLNIDFYIDGSVIRSHSTADSVKPRLYDAREHLTDEEVKARVTSFLEHVARQTVLQRKKVAS
ncbi:MAG: hypothetical protein WAM82_30110 [Thermoanaerobaculia bacterium]